MSFLYRPHAPPKQSAAIENIPKKYVRPRTPSTMGAGRIIIRRVSSLFLLKKKAPLDLKLANESVHTAVYASSYSSSVDTLDSEDDIRRPSGLGRAVSIMSNRSLPPSPFSPTTQSSFYTSQDYQRMRASSSPNLHKFINQSRAKPKSRTGSISSTNDPPPLPSPPSSASSFPSSVLSPSSTLPASSFPTQNSASLNITTTLYTGLRPATLMNPLRGISHLCLKFGTAVDRRTFEKVVVTAGGVLGEGDGFGLRSLEVGFHDNSSTYRDEALYKSLQISLPRYKALRSLRLFVFNEPFVHDHDNFEHYCAGLTSYNDVRHADDDHDGDDDRSRRRSDDTLDLTIIPSHAEQILIDSWLRLCPSLEVVTLFSGSEWRKELDDRQMV